MLNAAKISAGIRKAHGQVDTAHRVNGRWARSHNIAGLTPLDRGFAFIILFISAWNLCLPMAGHIELPWWVTKIQVVPAPQKAIPKKYQRRIEVDDGLRMVRIPTECPKCGGPLSPEEIDWVGPLEAKCNYCGSTVRAKFERI